MEIQVTEMTFPTSMRNRKPVRHIALGLGVAILTVAILAALVSSLPTPLLAFRTSDAPPTDPDRRFFEETGFEIAGEFLKYFDQHGGLEIFGYPISAAYNRHGVMVQYFQKARMEWHVVGPYANTVTLGNLGQELGFQNEGLAKPVRSTWRRLYFEETQHTVSHFFLKYFHAYAGVDLFGPPITEMFIEDQKVVQYFQRLKLVWDPRTMRVTTGSLGDLYVKTHGDSFPPNVLKPVDLQFGESREWELSAMLGVSHATLGTDHLQRIVVVVHNPSTEPAALQDANVTIKLMTKSGELIRDWSYAGSTDAAGRIEASIPLEAFVPGDVIIVKADVGYGTLRTEAETSFVVWW
jgi:hypothetical protein